MTGYISTILLLYKCIVACAAEDRVECLLLKSHESKAKATSWTPRRGSGPIGGIVSGSVAQLPLGSVLDQLNFTVLALHPHGTSGTSLLTQNTPDWSGSAPPAE